MHGLPLSAAAYQQKNHLPFQQSITPITTAADATTEKKVTIATVASMVTIVADATIEKKLLLLLWLLW
jgi:hypothetical protein